MIRLKTDLLLSNAVSFPRALMMSLFFLPASLPKLPQAAAFLPGPCAFPSRPRCRWSSTLGWAGALRVSSAD